MKVPTEWRILGIKTKLILPVERGVQGLRKVMLKSSVGEGAYADNEAWNSRVKSKSVDSSLKQQEEKWIIIQLWITLYWMVLFLFNFLIHLSGCFSAPALTILSAHLTAQKQVLIGVLLNKTTHNSASLEYLLVFPSTKISRTQKLSFFY